MDKENIKHIFSVVVICFLFMCFSMPAFAKSEDRVHGKVIRKKIFPNESKKNKSINTARKNTGSAGEMLRPKSDIAKAKPKIRKIKTDCWSG